MKGSVDCIQVADYVLNAYLPPSYDGYRKFPVLYMQDGGNLFLDNVSPIESFFKAGTLKEMMMIGIVPHNRLDEYTPWYLPALDSRYPNFGGKGEAYLDFLVQEIRPFINNQYCTLLERENTGIMGFSLGGLISMYAASLYPEIFGRIGSLSGSFWYEGFLEYLRAADSSYLESRIYIDAGELEGKNKSSIQGNMVENTEMIPEILQRKNLKPHNCRLMIHQSMDHNYIHFIKRFPAAIKWLFAVCQ